MSVNPTAGFGFRYSRNMSGGAPTCQMQQFYILSSYGTQIFKGDLVVFNAGYIQAASVGTTTIAGVFDGCEYLSTSIKMPRWSPYWPGSDSYNTTVKCWVITDPFAVFIARSNGANIGQASVDQNINFATGAGNTSSGLSTQTLDQSTIATSSTLPFRIINVGNNLLSPFLQYPANDSTTANNLVEVAFNNAMLRNNTAV